MRNTHRILLLVLAVCLALVSNAHATSSPNYRLDWMVPLTGGGGRSISANFAADLTVGQSTIGTASSSGYRAGIGYWHGILAEWLTRLPLVAR